MLHDLDYKELSSDTPSDRYSYTRSIIKDKFEDYDVLDHETCDMDYEYLESYNDYSYPEDYDNYTYHIVTKGEINRLDIVSYNCYGTAEYWWLIALANNLIDPRIVNLNSYLKIPSLASLYDKGGVYNNGFRQV